MQPAHLSQAQDPVGLVVAVPPTEREGSVVHSDQLAGAEPLLGHDGDPRLVVDEARVELTRGAQAVLCEARG
eukprot:1612021-Pleurochrysis_carterae.AAC.1